jgi:hypothetical protein
LTALLTGKFRWWGLSQKGPHDALFPHAGEGYLA